MSTDTRSALEIERLRYKPHVPHLLKKIDTLELVEGEAVTDISDAEKLKKYFPKTFGQPITRFKAGEVEKKFPPYRLGVVLSGGQAPGGHNVIAGIYDGLKKMHEKSRLFGFLGGPSGIVDNHFKEITETTLDGFRNTGGFDLIGSGRTKIESKEQLEAALKNCEALSLDGLVVIGGDDSNTNAAFLAEFFQQNGCKTHVVGVPKTIDGDLKNTWVETSFGFDSACKVYSELIGNIARDCLSAKKYTHFIKLMGRSASHITLECALKTHPNLALIGEEAEEKGLTLNDITLQICDLIEKRGEVGKNYGVILIPEGLIEFIPEMKSLIKELNSLMAGGSVNASEKLSHSAKKTFKFLPERIQKQLLLDRDPHGNVQVSHIDTQQLFIEKVSEILANRNFKGKFSPISHFFGYEGRSGFPSNFDANYCYSLGCVATLLIANGKTGYMSSLQGLINPPEKWEAAGLPITMLMNMEERKGKEKPVIRKALVNLKGEPFQFFSKIRERWSLDDDYCYPGPIQLFGPPSLCDETTETLRLEQVKKVKVGAFYKR